MKSVLWIVTDDMVFIIAWLDIKITTRNKFVTIIKIIISAIIIVGIVTIIKFKLCITNLVLLLIDGIIFFTWYINYSTIYNVGIYIVEVYF